MSRFLRGYASSDARSTCSAENPRASFERTARARRHRTMGPVADVMHRRGAATVGLEQYDHRERPKYPHLESTWKVLGTSYSASDCVTLLG